MRLWLLCCRGVPDGGRGVGEVRGMASGRGEGWMSTCERRKCGENDKMKKSEPKNGGEKAGWGSGGGTTKCER